MADKLSEVIDAIHAAGAGLSKQQWIDLLEEVSGFCDGHIEAATEELQEENNDR